MASLVDPQFKTYYIKEHKVETAKSRAAAQMLDEGQSTSQAALTASTALGGGRRDAAAALPPKGHKKTLGSFFKKPSSFYSVAASGLTDQQAIEAELKSYLLAPDADSETSPLAWWKIHCKT